MKVKLTKRGKMIAKSIEIPENVRVKFYSIFDDPNEFRIYYKNINEFKKEILNTGFSC